MLKRLRSHLTYANVMVTILAFVVLGGMSYAATGGNFILGRSNSAGSRTSLSAPIGNRALQLTNTSTAAGATALGLNTASGHPPLAVNSDAKVRNLNADRIDGADAVVQGDGKLARFDQRMETGTAVHDAFTLDGLVIRAGCDANGDVIALLRNTAAGVVLFPPTPTGQFYVGASDTALAVNDDDQNDNRVLSGIGFIPDSGRQTIGTLGYSEQLNAIRGTTKDCEVFGSFLSAG